MWSHFFTNKIFPTRRNPNLEERINILNESSSGPVTKNSSPTLQSLQNEKNKVKRLASVYEANILAFNEANQSFQLRKATSEKFSLTDIQSHDITLSDDLQHRSMADLRFLEASTPLVAKTRKSFPPKEVGDIMPSVAQHEDKRRSMSDLREEKAPIELVLQPKAIVVEEKKEKCPPPIERRESKVLESVLQPLVGKEEKAKSPPKKVRDPTAAVDQEGDKRRSMTNLQKEKDPKEVVLQPPTIFVEKKKKKCPPPLEKPSSKVYYAVDEDLLAEVRRKSKMDEYYKRSMGYIIKIRWLDEKYLQELKMLQCYADDFEAIPANRVIRSSLLFPVRSIYNFHLKFNLKLVACNTFDKFVQEITELCRENAFNCYKLYLMDEPSCEKRRSYHKTFMITMAKKHGSSFKFNPMKQLDAYREVMDCALKSFAGKPDALEFYKKWEAVAQAWDRMLADVKQYKP